jgi:hypothetical protein
MFPFCEFCAFLWLLSSLQRAGSLSQTQHTGISSVAIAAIHATAENPDASKADAEIVAIAAMPT